MIRSILLASTFALGLGTAQAAPQLVGGGEDSHVEYGGAPGGSLVGGGFVMLTGGGADRSYGYADLHAQPGRVAMLVGGGDEARLIYLPTDAPAGLAQGGSVSRGG
jgi:hypothetical protein